jgi:hypothetical protein
VDLGCYPAFNPPSLRVASLADPSEPTLVASLDTAWDDGFTRQLAVAGGLSFVESADYLIVGDATIPSSPRLVTLVDAGSSGRAGGLYTDVGGFDVEDCTLAVTTYSTAFGSTGEDSKLSLFDLAGVAEAMGSDLCDLDEDEEDDEEEDEEDDESDGDHGHDDDEESDSGHGEGHDDEDDEESDGGHGAGHDDEDEDIDVGEPSEVGTQAVGQEAQRLERDAPRPSALAVTRAPVRR